MKQTNKIAVSTAALVALIAVTGIAVSSFAANNSDNDVSKGPYFSHMFDKDNFDELMAEKEAWLKDREARHEKMDEIMDAGDYSAWAEEVKNMDDDAPILEKINEDNFSKLVEAHSLRKQARSIMEDLGIKNGDLGGKFKHHGHHGGMMHKMMENMDFDE